MDRIKYQEVLESIKIPDGMTQEEMVDALKPLNIALLQMIPKRLYKYRSCKDEHISAFEKDELWLSTSDLFNDPFDTLIQYDEGKIRSAFDCISQPDIFDAMLNHIAAGGPRFKPWLVHAGNQQLTSNRELLIFLFAKTMRKQSV